MPCLPEPRLYAWLINPRVGGGVYIAVVPMPDVTLASETAVRRALAGQER